MVQLTRIYTRGGDQGKTSLGDGRRILKNTLRIEAIGAVDEANAFVGMARLSLKGEEELMLRRVQNDLFDVGADLCMPDEQQGRTALRIHQRHIHRLEEEIDKINAILSPLKSFILPGGSEASTALHIARTVIRRAERRVCALSEKEAVNKNVIIYLNRLSDHFFVLARFMNKKGENDILWEPGANL
jgi:cob(I)alamin adenosyltransferase